jgi:biopolymer transport protein ExbD
VQFRRPGKPMVAINIAPLIDVVFLLVISFAVSTSFLDTAGLKLELPTSSSNAQREHEDITVLLAADGTLSMGGDLIDREELTRRLTSELGESERKLVILRADTSTPHGEVVGVMDLIREAGAEALTVAARASAGE